MSGNRIKAFKVNSFRNCLWFQNLIEIRKQFCLFSRNQLLVKPHFSNSFSIENIKFMTSSTSRLSNSTSPYLRQHANNPVNWYSWGDEALKLAQSEKKPIFLSIGYSTCHWCHVMAHESFEE